jgi:hypothetical protein
VIRALILCALVAPAAALAQCNTAAANQVQQGFREFGVWTDNGKAVEFKWNAVFDDLTPTEKQKLVHAFADADACIKGYARSINFYRKGKLVGRASPDRGIDVVE